MAYSQCQRTLPLLRSAAPALEEAIQRVKAAQELRERAPFWTPLVGRSRTSLR